MDMNSALLVDVDTDTDCGSEPSSRPPNRSASRSIGGLQNTTTNRVEPTASEADQRAEGQLLRLAMALIHGTREAAADRHNNVKRLQERVAIAAGQASPPIDAYNCSCA